MQVLKGVEEGLGDSLYLLVLWEHQRQLLFKHQHAGGHSCHDNVACFNGFVERWNILRHQLFDSLQIAKFKFWHTAAMLARREIDSDAVVL